VAREDATQPEIWVETEDWLSQLDRMERNRD